MDQIILAVDKNGKFLRYIPKSIGHQGQGQRHLAITVLLINSQGEVLLQKRKHQLFDNLWDFSGSTHPLHRADGTDENLEEATRRCLQVEWGIRGIRGIREIREIGIFNYFAKYGRLCENEHCVMMVGEYNGEVKLNPLIGYEYKWVRKEEFFKDVKANPKNYTPWVAWGAKILRKIL